MSWSDLSGVPVEKREDLLACARRSYQRDLILGRQAHSGSTLKGAAARYIGRYRKSRDNLISRIEDAGFDVEIVTRNRRHILVIKWED
jgi:hypothetical protein